MASRHDYPELRPVEVRPSAHHPGACELIDPSGVAGGVLTLSGPAVFIVSMMNGKRSRLDIQAEFMRRHGRLLFSEELDRLIETIDQAHFLAGPRFDAHMAELTRQYRRLSTRPILDKDAFGAPADQLGTYLDDMLNNRLPREASRAGGRVIGLIAPHLDYARGAPCYAAAYRDLARRTDARRFIILGTNHFGQAASVVGTRKDFDTPLGTVRHDADFMRRLDQRCGQDLCRQEYDHLHEHSIELQVVLLRHVLKDRSFTIVPYLCPDPCRPTGAAPGDGDGVAMGDFASALRAEIDADEVPTCVIAGADLSHVGRFFQDDRDLDADNLRTVETWDRKTLGHIVAGNPEAFLSSVRGASNATHHCSVGCIYVLATVLQDRAQPRLLHYHQALTPEAQNCVTCAALEFVPQ